MDTTGTPPSGHASPPPPPGGAHPPPGGAPPSGPPHGSDGFFDSVRRIGIARTPDRWIGGVAAGLAHRIGIDPLVVRGGFVVLSLFGGLPLVLYGLAWALLPEATDGRIHLQEAIRGRFDAALAGAAAFVVLGATRPVFWFDPDKWAPGWVIGLGWLGLLATIGVVALIVTSAARRPQHGGLPQDRDAPRTPAPTSDRPPSTDPTPTGEPFVTTPTPGNVQPAPYPAPAGGLSTAPPIPSTHPVGFPPSGPPSRAVPYAPTSPVAGGPPPDTPAPSGPASGGPGGGQQPPAPPPVPARSRAAGPGPVAVAVALSLCLFAGAGVLLADRAGLTDGHVVVTIAGVSLGILGLGVLVSGVRGRRSGVLGGLAILVAVLAVPAAVVANVVPSWERVVVSGDGPLVGDVRWRPTTEREAASGYSLGVGSAVIDLTDVPLDGAAPTPVEVPIDVAIGSATVVLPSDVPVRVTTHLAAGEIRSRLAGDWTRGPTAGRGATTTDEDVIVGPDTGSADESPGTVRRVARTELQGTNLELLLRSPAPGDVQLVVTVDAGLGDVTIQEELR